MARVDNKDVLFIYGTLLDEDVRDAVLGHAMPQQNITPAIAPDYAIYTVAGASYPCLLPAAGEQAEGAAVSGLTEEDFHRLDQFEGENYKRVPVMVHLAGDSSQAITAQYYQPNQSLKTNGRWSLSDWKITEKQNFLTRDFNLSGVRKPDA